MSSFRIIDATSSWWVHLGSLFSVGIPSIFFVQMWMYVMVSVTFFPRSPVDLKTSSLSLSPYGANKVVNKNCGAYDGRTEKKTATDNKSKKNDKTREYKKECVEGVCRFTIDESIGKHLSASGVLKIKNEWKRKIFAKIQRKKIRNSRNAKQMERSKHNFHTFEFSKRSVCTIVYVLCIL